ncbi:acyl-CoA synthetase [Actinomadura rubrisoli]|uniref:Acyl-CoA synthetase n=1 Tax=Actinomadura rubrisoli TaxID=2530368 RepID=A0A4R5B7C5_9ACTN|nr:acyl-CoA synthetase [Actinomadura rubrisoli]
MFPALRQGTASLDVGGERLGGDELPAAVGGVARQVAGASRVAVTAYPSLGTVVAVAGILAAGAAAVPVDPSSPPGERAHVLRDSDADLVLDGIDLGVRGDLPPDPPADDRPALVLYTSGSTGPPKGAVLPRRAIAANLDALAALWEWGPADVLAHALPFFHVHGLVFGGLGPLRLGSPLVHTGPFFRPVPQATLYFGVPTGWASLADEQLRELSRARLLVSGAGAIPRRLFDRIEALAGQRVLNRYAMTETLVITSPGVHDPRDPGSVGRPVHGMDLRLTDLDRDDEGDFGQVEVRGPHLFLGYLSGDRSFTSDGWFRTGDVGRWDEAGRLRLIGRADLDLIKTGGHRVGAGEVEDALLCHPGVAEAAVTGVPDDRLGQRVCAWAVPSVLPSAVPSAQLTVAELHAHLAERLAPYKRPLELRLVDRLPRNHLGKVQKKRLADPGRN